jgi:hypothetical protein
MDKKGSDNGFFLKSIAIMLLGVGLYLFSKYLPEEIGGFITTFGRILVILSILGFLSRLL